MRFISPSFNQQGWTKSFDLNSIAHGTSPAFTKFSEHPTGEEYADYLQHVASANHLNIQAQTEVTSVRPLRGGRGFQVSLRSTADTRGPAVEQRIRSRYVIWAAGEFQYPRAPAGTLFPGSELCRHNSSIRTWAEVSGNDFVVIGGYESGMDAACNLSALGKRCAVVSSTACWNTATDDPSSELAPHTAQRVREACTSANPPRLLAPYRVYKVEAQKGGGFAVRARRSEKADGPAEDARGQKMGQHRVPIEVGAAMPPSALTSDTIDLVLHTPRPPLLCVGFGGSVRLGVIKDLFEWGGSPADGAVGDHSAEKQPRKRARTADSAKNEDDIEADAGSTEVETRHSACGDGSPILSEMDESTKTPGLYLVGPSVRHKTLSFCFVYKFRQRFGIVADAIARGLGYPTTDAVSACREMGMFLDDFSCCKGACGEKC